MAGKDSKQAASKGIEYTVHCVETSKDPKTRGTASINGSYTALPEATAQAEKLFESGNYQTVEIRQKYFEQKKNREIEVVLRTLELGKKKEISVFIILIGAILCGAAAFGITYFLTKGG